MFLTFNICAIAGLFVFFNAFLWLLIISFNLNNELLSCLAYITNKNVE